MVHVKEIRLDEFEQRIKREKIICFCAGHGLRELCEVYPLLPGRIEYVADNYFRGGELRIGSHKLPVRPMWEVKEEGKNTLGVITSLQFADEIIKQMDNLKPCDGLEVVVPSLLPIKAEETEPAAEGGEVIPRKIHYCWFGKKRLPERFQKNIESWRKLCPDYELIRWDETNYDYTKNVYMKQAYESGKWGFVPDYARLDLIYTYGGIYLDTDVQLKKPFDALLGYKLFCGFENAWSVNFGLGFGGEAGNPILREMMQLYEETAFIRSDRTLNLTASPVYQTKVLAKHGLIRNGCCQGQEEFTAFSTDYFSPIDLYGYGRPTEKTYSIHQYAGTWLGEKQRAEWERTAASVAYVRKRMRNSRGVREERR